MDAHRFALGSIQSLADLQESPLMLDTKGIFAEDIAKTCRVPVEKFTGSLVLGGLGDLREVWITRNPNPTLMQAKFKRVF
jgi:hypothetical protein